MPSIKLIGTINGQYIYDPEYIAELLNVDKETLGIGKFFTGRPETRIYTNSKDVVKIRGDLNFSAAKAYEWATKILYDERRFSIHHPFKTWFIAESPSQQLLIGNVCPKLHALHIELKSPPETDSHRERYLQVLASVFGMYFIVAKYKNLKLDEGLSNFAIDEIGGVYYLDDEYYPWDDFVGFSVMLGVFIRTFEWLDKEFVIQLADILIELIDDIFQDLHCRLIISTQLQSLFMPSAKKKELIMAIIARLSQRPAQKYKIAANKK